MRTLLGVDKSVLIIEVSTFQRVKMFLENNVGNACYFHFLRVSRNVAAIRGRIVRVGYAVAVMMGETVLGNVPRNFSTLFFTF